jgi:phage internal scaffolding protein
MRYQGFSQPTGQSDEMESSAFVEIDRANPALYVDCSVMPSLTRQEFADECDVNKLMAQYEKTGILPTPVNGREPRYLDVSDVPDLASALSMLHAATEAFMSLPAIVRRDFDNDPQKFISFAENSENIPKLREWGLSPPEPTPPAPQEVRVVAMPELEPEPAPKKKG